MASNIDLYLDSGGSGLLARASGQTGSIPVLTRNDSYTFRIRVQNAPAGAVPSDVDMTGNSLKLGIGNIDDTPTDGSYKLIINGITSSAIAYNATTSQILTAVSNNVATVSVYGAEDFAYILSATQSNTALTISGDPDTLFPTSSVVVGTRRSPTVGVFAQQIIKLRRNPAVFANNFVASPTSGVATITKIQDGSTTANETYKVVFGSDAEGGSFVLNYGTNSTTAIAVGATAISASEALSAVTGIGSGNISVLPLAGENGYSISFVRSLGSQNITTALTLDASGIYFAPFREATITMGTSELDELFADSTNDTITPTLEIELVDGGNPKTLYQSQISIRKDLITSGSNVPASKDTYYTKSEADSLFVEDSTANVDATNRRLKNSSGTTIVDYGASLFGASGMVNLSASQVTIGNFPTYIGSTVTISGAVSLGSSLAVAGNAGFYGTSPIAKPSGVNAVSNVISLGLISSSSTYGVLPGSIFTLTTTASLNFGTIGGGNSVELNITVTGARPYNIVNWGVPTAVATGLVFDARISANDIVSLRAFNVDNQNHTAPTDTYRILVIGY